MRALWEGEVSFGLVSIPVKLYNATTLKDISFRFLHEKCKTPLEYEKYCPKCRHDVLWEDTVRGYEYEKGKFVVLKEEDFAKIPVKTTKSIEVVDVVDLKDIDPIFFEKTYYIVPREGGEEPYQLLKQAMEKTGKVCIAKITLRQKEHIAVLRVHGEAIVLETMYYWDEIRPVKDFAELEKEVKLSKEELEMALELLRSLATKFNPGKYADEYRHYLEEVIKTKLKGKELALPPVEEIKKAKSLMEALRASVDLAKRKKRAGK